MTTQGLHGVSILRLGLAGLLLWFGFSELANVAAWSIWVPQWAQSMSGLSAETIVVINAWFEIAFGLLLAIGVKVRLIAAILAAHLAIIAFDIGIADATGIRDLALALATLALVFLPPDRLALDARMRTTEYT